MSYTVTATKMRPSLFSQLAGQDFVAASLRKSVEGGKIAHAYLFSGPRGVGKTSAARILAKSINCLNSTDGNPCCRCSNCLEIAQGNSLDVIEIDGASNTSVNDVRQIKDEVLFAPANSRYKIYIIDEVHMLSNSAFNALLKTVEEPPPYIVFIFATTEAHKVPATIRSRCQHFNFRLIRTDVIKELLRNICTENNIKAEDDALFWIAKEATGSLRDAYTLFDKIASFSGDTISLEVLREKMGIAGFDRINLLAESMADGNGEKALSLLDEILGGGIAPEQLISELSEYFRNILLIKNNITRETVLGFPAGNFSRKVTDSFTSYQIEEALALILQLYRDIRYSLNQRFELELLTARLAKLRNHVPQEELLERLERLKEGFVPVSGGAAAPMVQKAENPVRTGAIQAAAPAAAPAPADVSNLRRDIIAAVRKSGDIILTAALEKSGEWIAGDDTVRVMCTDPFMASRLEESASQIEKEFAAFFGAGRRLEVECGSAEKGEGERNTAPGEDPAEMVKRVFMGEIIENRKERKDEF